MVWYGQVVVGPPGSGKTTYCNAMQQMCKALNRPVIIFNLDPANDMMPFDAEIDIRDLISVESIMNETELGPNGSLLYAMDYIKANLDWVVEQMKKHPETYVLVDCPGQVELYTHHQAMRDILTFLQKKMDFRLTVVHLIEAGLCADPVKYISGSMVALSCQLVLEMPQVNVLSKVDTLRFHRKELLFRIDFYAQAVDLNELVAAMPNTHPMEKKFAKFASSMVELLDDFNLIGFQLLDIQDKQSVLRVLRKIDTANGFVMGLYHDQAEGVSLDLVVGSWTDDTFEALYGEVQEKYIDIPNEAEANGEAQDDDDTTGGTANS
eukprot:Selendium_serpulae@DN6062_c0_g1_i4.p2